MGKSFPNIKGRTSNKKAAGQKKIRPRTVTAAIIRSIRVFRALRTYIDYKVLPLSSFEPQYRLDILAINKTIFKIY